MVEAGRHNAGIAARATLVAFGAVAAGLIVLHLFFPDGWTGELTYLGVTLGAGAVALCGAARQRGRFRAPLFAIALGVMLSGVGDLVFYSYVHLRGTEPDISVADIGWLLSYVAIIVGLFGLLRSNGRRARVDVDALIDMGVVAVVSLLVIWQTSLQATVTDESTPILVRVVWAAYPILDAMLLAVVARLAFTRPSRRLATVWLAAGTGCWLASDFLALLFPSATAWTNWLDAGWMAGSALLAAAVWAGMPEPEEPVVPIPTSVGAGRIALVIIPLLVPPVLVVVGYFRGFEPDPLPMFAAALVLGGLAYARAMRIVRTRTLIESELRASERQFEALVQRSSDAALILDADGTIRYVSSGAIEQFGYTPDDLVGQVGWSLIHPDDLARAFDAFGSIAEAPGTHARAELRVVDGRGGWRWVEEVVTNLLDEPAVHGLVANIRDITDRKEAELKLARMALYDELTGLPNRWRVIEVVEELHATGRPFGLLSFDLDRFRLVNARGRPAGDRLLGAVGERVQRTLPPEATVARFGGNIFCVVLPDVTHWASVAGRARQVQEAVTQPFDIPGAG